MSRKNCLTWTFRGSQLEPGAVERVRPPIEPHGSKGLLGFTTALGALEFAISPMVARTLQRGTLCYDKDWPEMVCSSVMEPLWVADATKALTEFTCRVAEKIVPRDDPLGLLFCDAITLKRELNKRGRFSEPLHHDEYEVTLSHLADAIDGYDNPWWVMSAYNALMKDPTSSALACVEVLLWEDDNTMPGRSYYNSILEELLMTLAPDEYTTKGKTNA